MQDVSSPGPLWLLWMLCGALPRVVYRWCYVVFCGCGCRFVADGPPTGGAVQTLPEAGYAVTTDFSATTSGWFDESVPWPGTTVGKGWWGWTMTGSRSVALTEGVWGFGDGERRWVISFHLLTSWLVTYHLLHMNGCVLLYIAYYLLQNSASYTSKLQLAQESVLRCWRLHPFAAQDSIVTSQLYNNLVCKSVKVCKCLRARRKLIAYTVLRYICIYLYAWHT